MSGDRGTQKSLSPDAYFSVSVFVSEPSLPARKILVGPSAPLMIAVEVVSSAEVSAFSVSTSSSVPADIESSQIPVLIVGCKKKDHVVICGIIAFRCSGKFRFLCGVFRSTSVV